MKKLGKVKDIKLEAGDYISFQGKTENCLKVLEASAPKPDKIEKAVLEKLAELEHLQWLSWTEYLIVNNEVPKKLAKKWAKTWKPYDELPEDVKEKDRIWARKVLKILSPIIAKTMAECEKEKVFPPKKFDIDKLGEEIGDVCFTEKQSLAMAEICDHLIKNVEADLLKEIKKIFCDETNRGYDYLDCKTIFEKFEKDWQEIKNGDRS